MFQRERQKGQRQRERERAWQQGARGAIDLFLIAVLAGERRQSVVVADGARKVVH